MTRTALLAILLAFLPATTGAAAQEPLTMAPARAYVAGERSEDLTVVDLATGRLVATVPLGKQPRGLAASPDGRLLYIALGSTAAGKPSSDADGIGVFDVAQNRLVRVLPGISDPQGIAVGPAGDRLYVASGSSGQLIVMAADSGAIVARAPAGGAPGAVGASPDGELALIVSKADSTASVIEARTGQARHKIKVGAGPRGVLFAAGRAFVPGEHDASIAALDLLAGKLAWRLVLAGTDVRPMGMAAAGPAVFVTTGGGGELVRIDPSLGAVTGRVKLGGRPWGMAATPDGRYVVTANGPSNDLAVIDAGTLQVVARYAAGDRPRDMAVLPAPDDQP